jgi:hypothetical protein
MTTDAALPAYADCALAALRALAAAQPFPVSRTTQAARSAAFSVLDCAAMGLQTEVLALVAAALGLTSTSLHRHLALDVARHLVVEAERARHEAARAAV